MQLENFLVFATVLVVNLLRSNRKYIYTHNERFKIKKIKKAYVETLIKKQKLLK